MKIAICIVTFNRLAGLIRLINSLKGLEFKKSAYPNWLLIIVDNDINAPTKETVSMISRSYPRPIRYDIERNRGIASARNHAVRLAYDCDVVVFIDDDEVPDPNWLDELLNIQNQFNADIVAGPVLPIFDQDVPKWILKGGFFNRKRFNTGKLMKHAATGNMLVRTELLKKIPGPFDERFNFTGGEDTLFSILARKLDAMMVWANDAIVYEYNTKDRLTAKWILRRAWRLGLTISRVEQLTEGSFRIITLRFCKGVIRLLLGFITLLPRSIFFGLSGLVKSLQMIVKGTGEIFGLLGVLYQEYK